MRMRPVRLLSPAATTRRRAHALVFNFASVGREALLDGCFAPETAVRSAALLTLSRLSTIEVPVHLRSPGVMVPVQASAERQPMPRRPYRAAPSRRSRTQGQEAAAAPLRHRERANPRSARWQEAG